MVPPAQPASVTSNTDDVTFNMSLLAAKTFSGASLEVSGRGLESL